MKNKKKLEGYVKRLATEEEVLKFYDCFVNENWGDIVNHKDTTYGKEDYEKGYESHREKTLAMYKKSIGGIVIVDEFSKENCAIYTASNMFEIKSDNWIMCDPYRVMRIEDTYTVLDNEASGFDFELEILTKKTISLSKNQVGRPSCPTEASITKTLAIRSLLTSEKKIGIDTACELEELSKSTYYSTLKWIKKHPIN